MKNYI